MSLYQSINQLWLKLKIKNIVLCSGNVDEIIPTDSKIFQDNFRFDEILDKSSSCAKNKFFNLSDVIAKKAQTNQFNSVIYFHPNKGMINLLNPNEKITQNNYNENEDNEFADFENDNDSDIKKISINDFIDSISESIETSKQNPEINKILYILNFGDLYFQNNSDVTNTKLTQILTSFVEFQNYSTTKFRKDYYKILIICKTPNVINSLITNNVEFGSLTILKPNKNERKEFFEIFHRRFDCVDFEQNYEQQIKNAITISEGLSLREIYQFAKIDDFDINMNQNEKFNFSQLYNFAMFSKKDSEWEKIDYEQLKNIDYILSKRVKGQVDAIESVKQSLIRSYTGMNGILHSLDNNKPKGVLFFAGPTGTGKTELAKSISEFIFGDENRIIRFDMSEYNHEHSDQRLIGAPPGYVGYDAGGQLTNQVKEKPFSILLFDEIEKAHPKILDKFLQILEDGRLTSSQGEIIDFSQTFIIFTSNLGANSCDKTIINDNIKTAEHFIKSVKKYFEEELKRPEILNRINIKNIIPFQFIQDEQIINDIIKSKLEKLIHNLRDRKMIELIYNNYFLNDLSKKISSKLNYLYGGRGILTELETILIDPLSMFIFDNSKIINSNKLNNKKLILILVLKKIKYCLK